MTSEGRTVHREPEISEAHDTGMALSEADARHVDACDRCAAFRAELEQIDRVLGAGRFEMAADVVEPVLEELGPTRRNWWAVAAFVVAGLTVGALLGTIGSRVDVGLAQDLSDILYRSGPAVKGLTADLVVVERGVHPDVPERIYRGSIRYAAPESLSIGLTDTTDYPSEEWIHNDLAYVVADGATVASAGSSCPVTAMPGCLQRPTMSIRGGQIPFSDGTVRPLEIVGPGRSFSLTSALDVIGRPVLDGSPTIQVSTTVAAAEFLRAITGRGAWRELHPTDPVILWLDSETLAPRRVEVFAADSPERRLWQVRRGYRDDLISPEPIFIVSIDDLRYVEPAIDVDLPDDAMMGPFVDGELEQTVPTLPKGFQLHRAGHWALGDGGDVRLASWSDGRSWLKLEVTGDWTEDRLFGLPGPFVQRIQLGNAGVGYLSPTADAIFIHSETEDLVLSGTVPREVLVQVASSLDVQGVAVPSNWPEASVVDVDAISGDFLVPTADGWSIAARPEEGRLTLAMNGGGERSVLILQVPGEDLELPVGPDVSVQSVRGVDGRYDASSGTLVWVEDGSRVQMQSETVSLDELLSLADGMVRR